MIEVSSRDGFYTENALILGMKKKESGELREYTVQFRCNFTLAREQFIRTLEPFTRARIGATRGKCFITREQLTQDY